MHDIWHTHMTILTFILGSGFRCRLEVGGKCWVQWVWSWGIPWWLIPHAASVPWKIQTSKYSFHHYWKWGFRWDRFDPPAISLGAFACYLCCHDHGSDYELNLYLLKIKLIFHKHRFHVRLLVIVLQGVRVLGYLFWTISDNWEWADGYGPKFGLVAVDRANNLARIPRPSYHLFSKVRTPYLYLFFHVICYI